MGRARKTGSALVTTRREQTVRRNQERDFCFGTSLMVDGGLGGPLYAWEMDSFIYMLIREPVFS